MKYLLISTFLAIGLIACKKKPIIPVPPSTLNAVATSTSQINLNWTDNSTNETGFKIERKQGNSNYSIVATVGADITNFSDVGLTANTTYTYRVYAYNQAGNSISYSNEASASTFDPVALGLANGLVAYYPFTGNAGDSSGNGNHGTVNGATLSSDRFGIANKAYSFNGTSNFIETNLLPPTGNNTRSFSLWFKFSSFPGFDTAAMLSYGANTGNCTQAGGNFSLELYKNPSSSAVNFRWDGVFSAVQYENDINSNWHHVVVVYNSQSGNMINSGKIYIDGSQVSTATYNGNTAVNTLLLSKLKIGLSVSTNSRFFKGVIDDIRIYNRLLSENEIQYLAFH